MEEGTIRKRSMELFLLSVCLAITGILMLPGTSFAAWVPDTFNPAVTCVSGYEQDCVHDVAVQADGKIIIGGYISSPGSFIARFNSDGTPDTTFNSNAIADDHVDRIVVQSNGKIIIGGRFTQVNNTARLGIARLNSDGTLDTTFNPLLDNLDNSELHEAAVTELALQANGNLLVGGTFKNVGSGGTPANLRPFFARLITAGTGTGAVDTGFNPNVSSTVHSIIVLDSLNKILIGGNFYKMHCSYCGIVSNPTTTTDPLTGAQACMDADGITYVDYGQCMSAGADLVNYVALLNMSDGSQDTSLQSQIDVGQDRVYALARQSNGQIIVGGGGGDSSPAFSSGHNYIVRLNTDGSIDGNYTTNANNQINALALQASDNLITAGTFTVIGGVTRNSIARLNSSGSVDTTFDPNANGTINTLYSYPSGTGVIVGGGFTTIGGTTRYYVARLHDDGTTTSSTSITSSLNPSLYGNLVTFTATVTSSGGTPTGTVNFMDSTTQIGSGTLSGGIATFSTTALSVGTHSITAVYAGNTTFTGSSSLPVSQTVNKASTTTSVISSLNPSPYGSSVTFTATVTGSGGTPTGTVNFMDGATLLGPGTLSGGHATYSTTALSVGAHSITAVYAGDANFATSTSSVLSQTVNKASTTTSVTSSSNPSAYGNPVTFTATVTGSGGTPTGAVSFMDSTTQIGSGTLSGGTATIVTSALGGGQHSITAVYSGDANFVTSTSSVLSQTVNQVPTTTTISAPAATYNGNGLVTVTVTSLSGAVTGTVSLTVDSGQPSSQSLINGSAAFTITSPSVGSHALSALYASQGSFGASSNTGSLTVNPAPTTTTISAPAIAYGADGVVTVTVSPTSQGVPLLTSGNVYLSVNGGVETLQSITGTGTATFTITKPAYGTYSLSARYPAQGNYGASTATGQLSVGGAVTTTTITPPPPITYGADGIVTVMVSSGTGTPTGSVSLSVDGTALPAQGLVGGSTTFTINKPIANASPGHTLSASYAAQGSFGASSGTGTLTVNKAVLTVTANNASKVYDSANPVFTASYSGFVTPDTQAVLGGSPSLTTTATTTSPVGTYPITAAVGGLSAANYSFSFVNGTLTVTPASTLTGVASSVNPAISLASVTFTATVTSSGGIPTGTVNFMDGTTLLGPGTLSGGIATFSTTALSAGSHSITAVYGGDANFTTSTSSVLSQTVNKASTLTSVASSVNPATYLASVTFTATVTSSGGIPTGTVNFMDGTTLLGSGTLSGGIATFSTTALSDGSHSITAVYGGDANFTTSTTLSAVNEVVVPDGKLDITSALRIAAGIDQQQPTDLVHADVAPVVNGVPHPDGKIDIDDVVMILRKADGESSW